MQPMSKNKVEVIIGGNIYTLQSDMPKEHIQKVAQMIDEQITSIQKNDLSQRLSTSQLYMLTALNIADEYIKVKKDFERYEKELEKCSNENIVLMEKLKEMGLEKAKTRTKTKGR